MSNVLPLQQERDVPLTEPEIIPCLYSSGFVVKAGEYTFQLVFWSQLEDERRIQGRFVVPIGMAMELHKELGKDLGRLRALGH